jgi:hypothetical protein
MGGTSVHKPHIKRLDKPPPPPEPIVKIFILFLGKIDFEKIKLYFEVELRRL